MECLYCAGSLQLTQISYTATRKGYHLIIENVPAWVCQQCGEPMFDEATVTAIQEILQEVEQRLALLTTFTSPRITANKDLAVSELLAVG